MMLAHPPQHRLPPRLMHHHRRQMQRHQSRQNRAEDVMQFVQFQQRGFRMNKLWQRHKRQKHDRVTHHQHTSDQNP